MRRLLLVNHATTAMSRRPGFPAVAGRAHEEPGEPPDEAGLAAAARLRTHLPRIHRCWTSHATRAVTTARSLGFEPERRMDDLADIAYGPWAGRTLADIEERDPAGLASWLADPARTPDGAESYEGARCRVRRVLQEAWPLDGTTLAVTHGMFIRTVLLDVLALPPTTAWQLDVAPASVTELRPSPRGWRIARVNWTATPSSWHAPPRPRTPVATGATSPRHP